jgi:hypothetical protein
MTVGDVAGRAIAVDRRPMLSLEIKSLAAVTVIAATLIFGARADAGPTTVPQPVSYSDGAVAYARPQCATGDLCATITLPDGDDIRVYNRGAARCRPFKLELVTLHGEAVMLRSEVVTATRPGKSRTCPQFANTYVMLDSGEIRMGIFLAKDGTLFVEFLSAIP